MLAEKLGKSQQEILTGMAPTEFKQWVAYFSLQDEDFKDRIEAEVSKENSAKMTDEERAEAIRNMLIGLQGNGTDR